MLLTTGMKSMPKDKIISNLEEETWSRRGWGGGYILNIVIAKEWGFTIFICNYSFFWGGGGLKF